MPAALDPASVSQPFRELPGLSAMTEQRVGIVGVTYSGQMPFTKLSVVRRGQIAVRYLRRSVWRRKSAKTDPEENTLYLVSVMP